MPALPDTADSAPVLVVDDDKLVLAYLADVLQTAGARVIGVETVERAVETLAERPLLAFVDLHLPGEQGDAFCRSIRLHTDRWDLPVVMITADQGTTAIRRAFLAGADDYIRKPLEERCVLSKLAAVRAAAGEPVQVATRTKRVLVATEKLYFGTVVGRLLEKAGYERVAVRSLSEAQESLAGTPAALAIVDLDLPGALALVERLDAAVPPVAVVAVATQAAKAKLPRRLADLAPYDVETELEHLLRRVNRFLLGSVRAERRAAARIPFHAEVRFRVLGETGPWLAGASFDLSETGIYVRTLTPLHASRPVEVSFKLTPERQATQVAGLVVWANPYGPRTVLSYPYGMGVTFSDFPVAEWNVLREFIEQQQKSGG